MWRCHDDAKEVTRDFTISQVTMSLMTLEFMEVNNETELYVVGGVDQCVIRRLAHQRLCPGGYSGGDNSSAGSDRTA
jgi:hypothetical protein